MSFRSILAAVRKTLSGRGNGVPQEPLSLEEQLVHDYKLRLYELHDELPELNGQRDAMRAAWRGGDFEAFHRAFEAARASSVIAANGKPLYALVKDWFLEPFMALPDYEESVRPSGDELAPFREFFHRSPSAFSAATYADALRAMAFVRRGTAWAQDVRGDQWQGYEELLGEADAVLDSCPDPADFSWRMSDYSRSANTGDFDTFKARFERAWLMDRYNIDLCRAHARMIMPRWLGRNEHDLENFARRAAELTKDRFGLGFYALIQQANTEVGDHELADTLCDPDLVKQGFEDLLVRFPAPSVMNLYADTLEWMGDTEALADLLESRFRVMVPQIWYGETRSDKISYLFATLLEAAEVLEARRAAR
ncbi:hypothetical protein [Shinella zoogloeoides]|uniref:DUF4034 domain-containing protein n=1 Tax=Shinella zoogloeoides TaxID=352475 RepID=A0A6N8TEI2_SHIZO|nr:hypothetical protein [Shinella zoogloeoides]MXO00586.1 hypothetical protein [Shinella zoogloeoides]UEX80015.1 hypothetical protein K8M09_10260 [Shinella zoogloeoides]